MASSLLKVHFGHYIAGTFNPNIAIINAKMVELPQHWGKSLKQWTKRLNVMLEKIPGNAIWTSSGSLFYLKPTLITIIIMVSVEQAGLLTPEQYGCRKKKSANLQCLNK